eukprot:scaffold2849_cov203-Alexandrium_tamarense.AAC.10
MDFDEIGFFGVPFASPLNDKTKKKNGSCNGGGKSTKKYGKTTVNSSRVVGAASTATNAATGARLSSKSSTLRRARKSKPSSLATLNGDKVRGSAAAAAVGPFAKSVTKKRRLPLAKDADDSVCNDRMHGVTNGIDNGGGVDADDDDSSSSCSSDDEALSDLKPRSASSALTNGASEAVSASRSRPLANPKPKSIAKATLKSSSGGASGRSVRISNDSVSNKSVTKPGTKQLGLHSFLAKTSPNNTTSSFVKSGAGKSSSVASNKHSKRLLHGDSGVNILSQLFQRSILSSTPRTTASVTKFVQAGRMWNVSETVRLNPSVNHSNAPLNYNSSNAGVNIGEGGEVTAMSFDKEGVLLATGDDRGVIHVFDFDDVFAMDGRKRNEKGYMEGERIGLERDVGGVVSGNEIGVDEKEGIDLRKETEESMREEACSEQQQPAISTITPGSSHPLLSFQCRAKSSVGGGGVSPRVSSLHWNPDNQDHLAVSFA